MSVATIIMDNNNYTGKNSYKDGNFFTKLINELNIHFKNTRDILTWIQNEASYLGNETRNNHDLDI